MKKHNKIKLDVENCQLKSFFLKKRSNLFKEMK